MATKVMEAGKRKGMLQSSLGEIEDAIQVNSVNISSKYFLPVPVKSPRFSSKTCNTQPSSLAL